MDGMDFSLSSGSSVRGDWDFANARPSPLSKLHPYPAKFIPEIPRRLIETYPPADGTLLLDPFCGSGTTLTEAQLLGLVSVGVDLNPIAVLMSRIKTAPLPSDAGAALSEVVEIALADTSFSVPEIPRLDHWFRPDVQVAISSLSSAIIARGGEARDLLRLALSSIIVRVSNQESDTRYAAVEKAVGREDVFKHFLRAGQRIIEALRLRPMPLAQVEVIESDILAVGPDVFARPVGLVVTSPPYPNAYEYWLYHKYRMWWLGFDPLAVKAREIGARAHFFKGSNSHTADDFVHQISGVMALLDAVMIKGGHACFVVGRSRIQGKFVDNAAIITKAGADHGFAEVIRAERVLAATRKSFNLSHANIKTETVLVLRKES
jgi:hypothetical protein